MGKNKKFFLIILIMTIPFLIYFFVNQVELYIPITPTSDIIYDFSNNKDIETFIGNKEKLYNDFSFEFTSSPSLGPGNYTITIQGEVPPKDYYEIFTQLINIFLTKENYKVSPDDQVDYFYITQLSIYFQSGEGTTSFVSNSPGVMMSEDNTPYGGLYHWWITVPKEISGNANTEAELFYQEDKFVYRDYLGNYGEEPFNYRKFFGFEESIDEEGE